MSLFAKTSGEENAYVGIGVARIPVVHVSALGIKIAKVNELAIGIATISFAFFHLVQRQFVCFF